MLVEKSCQAVKKQLPVFDVQGVSAAGKDLKPGLRAQINHLAVNLNEFKVFFTHKKLYWHPVILQFLPNGGLASRAEQPERRSEVSGIIDYPFALDLLEYRVIFECGEERLLIPLLDKPLKVPLDFPRNAFIALPAAPALRFSSEAGRSRDNNDFFKEFRVAQCQRKSNSATHRITDKKAGFGSCRAAQLLRQKVNRFGKKEVGVTICLYFALPVSGQINQNAAVLLVKLLGKWNPVAARAQKAVQKENAGKGSIAYAFRVEWGLTLGGGFYAHNVVDRLLYLFTVVIRKDFGLIYEPCASAGNPFLITAEH